MIPGTLSNPIPESIFYKKSANTSHIKIGMILSSGLNMYFKSECVCTCVSMHTHTHTNTCACDTHTKKLIFLISQMYGGGKVQFKVLTHTHS